MKASQWKQWLLAATVVMFFFPPASWGSETDTDREPWEKFGIQAGYFLSAVDSGFRLGARGSHDELVAQLHEPLARRWCQGSGRVSLPEAGRGSIVEVGATHLDVGETRERVRVSLCPRAEPADCIAEHS